MLQETTKMNKREFLKLGITGLGGIALANNALGNGLSSLLPGDNTKPWRWSKEATYYINTPKGVKCKLCPQNCTIKEGETGDCRTRTNYNGKLYSMVYGNPCAIHIDPVEKKPLSHFLPGSLAYSIATAGCNLACLNCQNWTISQKAPAETRNYNLMPADVVEEAVKYDCKSIAYTYSEPVVFYEYVYDTAKIARTQGIKNIFVSAGYINKEPLREICKYLDAANIDLKSFSDDIYEMLNAGTLQPVLDALKIFKDEGVWLEITNLVIPSWTDDTDMIKKMCDWLYDNGFEDTPLYFSRFHPAYKLKNVPATPVETIHKARNIALEAGLKFVYTGNIPGDKGENTYCPSCKKLLIERYGFTIKQNNIVDGKCKYCGTSIPGVWK
jgi:pyruvate formate lyase activating enzyme